MISVFMSETRNAMLKLFHKFNVVNRNAFAQLMTYFLLLLNNGTVKCEEGYGCMLHFYKALLESIGLTTLTSTILASINAELKGEVVYIPRCDFIISPNSVIDSCVELLSRSDLEIRNVMTKGLTVSVSENNTFTVCGATAATVRECLWILLASTARQSLGIDSLHRDPYVY